MENQENQATATPLSPEELSEEISQRFQKASTAFLEFGRLLKTFQPLQLADFVTTTDEEFDNQCRIGKQLRSMLPGLMPELETLDELIKRMDNGEVIILFGDAEKAMPEDQEIWDYMRTEVSELLRLLKAVQSKHNNQNN